MAKLTMQDITDITTSYEAGKSINELARIYHTYPTSITRILVKQKVTLRHDRNLKGKVCVKDGDKLIAWAKAQKKPVTKTELAAVLGKKSLSHSYFVKYPELSRYLVIIEQKEFLKYYEKLYEWLQDNKIPYKPNDRKTLGVTVDALLLGDYKNIALEFDEKPTCVSARIYAERKKAKMIQAKKSKTRILFLKKELFENLDDLKKLLNKAKRECE